MKQSTAKFGLMVIVAGGLFSIAYPFFRLYQLAQIYGWDTELDIDIKFFVFGSIIIVYGVLLSFITGLVLITGAYKEWCKTS